MTTVLEPGPVALRAEVHTTPDAWLRLRMGWLALQEEMEEANPFLTWQWQEAWWRAFGAAVDLRLVTFHEGERLVAIAPMCLDHDGALRFCGGLEVSDHLGLLCRPGRWHAAGHALISLWHEQGWGELDLHFLREDSPTLEALVHALRREGVDASPEPEEVSPAITLPASFDDYLSSLGKKERHELRRKQRRLEAEPEVRFTECCERALQDDLGDFFRLHRLSSQAKADFLDPQKEAFFRDCAEALHDAGWLGLRFLEAGGQRVAAILTFVYRDRVFLYNSGYDPGHGRLSVGLMLIAEDIRQAIAQGRREYDFLRGAEPYKYDLGASDLRLMRLRVERP